MQKRANGERGPDRKPRKKRTDITLAAVKRRARRDPSEPRLVIEGGLDSLSIQQAIYRNDELSIAVRAEAARAALPFEHKRMPMVATIVHEGDSFVGWLERLAVLRQDPVTLALAGAGDGSTLVEEPDAVRS